MKKAVFAFVITAYMIELNNSRICEDGGPMFKYKTFKGPFPGADSIGQCFIKDCKMDECSTWNNGNPTCTECPKDSCVHSHSIEVPNCINCEDLDIFEIPQGKFILNSYGTEELPQCSPQGTEFTKTKSVIRSPKNAYCTKNQICGFENISIIANSFTTKEPKVCHVIPEAITASVETYKVLGRNFNETIKCSFKTCD